MGGALRIPFLYLVGYAPLYHREIGTLIFLSKPFLSSSLGDDGLLNQYGCSTGMFGFLGESDPQ